MSVSSVNTFSDLTPFFEKWAHASFKTRYRRRIESTQEELKSFYNAILPRMDAITEHLNQYQVGNIPNEELPLYFLACSFMDIAAAVEIYDQPDVPLGLEWFKPVLTECKTPLSI